MNKRLIGTAVAALLMASGSAFAASEGNVKEEIGPGSETVGMPTEGEAVSLDRHNDRSGGATAKGQRKVEIGPGSEAVTTQDQRQPQSLPTN